MLHMIFAQNFELRMITYAQHPIAECQETVKRCNHPPISTCLRSSLRLLALSSGLFFGHVECRPIHFVGR